MKFKKMISAISAAAICISAAAVFPASAADGPELSFRAGETMPVGVSVKSDGSLLINKRMTKESGDSLYIPVSIYYSEPTAGAWFVRANWKCTAPTDTLALSGLTSPYTTDANGNKTAIPLDTPYAFARKTADGKYMFKPQPGEERDISVNDSIDTTLNTMGFTCQSGGSYDGPLIPLGEKTDSYPFADFALTLSNATAKAGDYDLHFISQAEDNPDQRFCEVNIKHDISVPAGTAMKIQVIDYLLGDVNNDGFIDSSDASAILADYATVSTGGTSSFDEITAKVADVNFDQLADSSDASSILGYYAYASTAENAMSIEDFLQQ